jgi:hypothetical protein
LALRLNLIRGVGKHVFRNKMFCPASDEKQHALYVLQIEYTFPTCPYNIYTLFIHVIGQLYKTFWKELIVYFPFTVY